MSNTTTITDRRLLAALDYIDQKYIDDVFNIIKEPEADTAVPVRSWRTPLKHSKIYIALAASLLLLAMASPLVNIITYVVSNFTAGAGSGTESSEILNTEITDAIESESQMIDTDLQTIETEIDSTEVPETEPPYRSPILDAYNDMSVTEIYEDVLNGNWVVMTEGWTKSQNIELWDAFLDSVDQGKPSTVLFAQYTTWEDLAPHVQEKSNPEDYPHISLTELYYDGKTFMMTEFIDAPEGVKLYTSLPYLLTNNVNGYTYYYLGQYQDSIPPDSSFLHHGYSVYVFLDRSRKTLQ